MNDFDTPVILKEDIQFLMLRGSPINPYGQKVIFIKAGTIGNVIANGSADQHTVRFYGIEGSMGLCDVNLDGSQLGSLTREEWALHQVLHGS